MDVFGPVSSQVADSASQDSFSTDFYVSPSTADRSTLTIPVKTASKATLLSTVYVADKSINARALM